MSNNLQNWQQEHRRENHRFSRIVVQRLELGSDPFVFSVPRVLCGLLFISSIVAFPFPDFPKAPLGQVSCRP